MTEALGSGGHYRLKSRYSGKVLDVLGRSTADGTDIVQIVETNAVGHADRAPRLAPLPPEGRAAERRSLFPCESGLSGPFAAYQSRCLRRSRYRKAGRTTYCTPASDLVLPTARSSALNVAFRQ